MGERKQENNFSLFFFLNFDSLLLQSTNDNDDNLLNKVEKKKYILKYFSN